MSERAASPLSSADERWKSLNWRIIPERLEAPTMNMALDESLTLRVGRGARQPTLRIWGWKSKCVVLGRFQSVKNEVDEIAAAENDVSLVRRISGGGAMFIEPEGAITYSIFAPESIVKGLSFPESYAFFDSWVVESLRELGVDAWYAPLNDIASAGGKIGGAAQARRGGAVLHHTTIAYQMNMPLMLKVLRIGKEKLSDKGIQSADKRVGPLRQQTNLERNAIIAHMIETFRRKTGGTDDDISAEERAESEGLVKTRFGTHDWIYILP